MANGNTQGFKQDLSESLWSLLKSGLALALDQFVRHSEWMLVIVSLQQGDLLGLFVKKIEGPIISGYLSRWNMTSGSVTIGHFTATGDA